jgi:hypothetical protein
VTRRLAVAMLPAESDTEYETCVEAAERPCWAVSTRQNMAGIHAGLSGHSRATVLGLWRRGRAFVLAISTLQGFHAGLPAHGRASVLANKRMARHTCWATSTRQDSHAELLALG